MASLVFVIAAQLSKDDFHKNHYRQNRFRFYFNHHLFFLLSAGFEAQTRIKRPRALPAEEEPENYVDQEDLEERNNPLSPNYVPPGFLSPSVQEYLELGKSIPGKFNYQSFHPQAKQNRPCF